MTANMAASGKVLAKRSARELAPRPCTSIAEIVPELANLDVRPPQPNPRQSHTRCATLAAMRLASVIGIAALAPALAAAEPRRLKLNDATLVVNEPETLDDLTLTLERAGKPVWTLRGWKAIAAGGPAPGILGGVCERFGIGLIAQ